MARPRKYFKNKGQAVAVAREKGHFLWRYVHKGYLGTGYFVGKQLPQKILVTSAFVTRNMFSRKTINGKPERPW